MYYFGPSAQLSGLIHGETPLIMLQQTSACWTLVTAWVCGWGLLAGKGTDLIFANYCITKPLQVCPHTKYALSAGWAMVAKCVEEMVIKAADAKCFTLQPTEERGGHYNMCGGRISSARAERYIFGDSVSKKACWLRCKRLSALCVVNNLTLVTQEPYMFGKKQSPVWASGQGRSLYSWHKRNTKLILKNKQRPKRSIGHKDYKQQPACSTTNISQN